jgi:hypothetical protein
VARKNIAPPIIRSAQRLTRTKVFTTATFDDRAALALKRIKRLSRTATAKSPIPEVESAKSG